MVLIAAAAGMSQRSFFRYLPTKDEVLRRHWNAVTARLVDAFRSRPEHEDPVAALRAAYLVTSRVEEPQRRRIHAFAQMLAAVPDVWAMALGESLLDERMAAELARRCGTDPTDPRPSALAAATAGAAASAWTAWIRSDGADDPSGRIARALDLVPTAGADRPTLAAGS